MSHTVKLVLENISEEVVAHCNSCLNMLSSIPKWNDAYMDNYIQEQFEKIESIKNDLESKYKGTINGTNATFLKLKQDLDKTLKNVTNIYTNISSYGFLENREKQQKDLINAYILEYGKLAISAIDSLTTSGVEINEQNLSDKVNELRNEKINQKNYEENKKIFFVFIDQNKFSGDIRFALKKIFSSEISNQELNDAYAYVASKKVEENKIDNLAKKLFNFLTKEQGFELSKKIETLLDDDGIMRKAYILRNKLNNRIKIEIDGNMNIRYKLGNYEGHACEKTSEQMFKCLENNGYFIKKKEISRNIDNSKPLFKAAILKEKESF